MAALFALQSLAGNRAVTQLLHRRANASGLVVQRRVASSYPDIRGNLTGLWVSDGDEYKVISALYTVLSGSKVDFYDTVKAMQRDGLLATFLSELPSGARATHSMIIPLMEAIRDNRLTSQQQLEFRRSLDWVHTPADADAAFSALQTLTQADRDAIVPAIPRGEYESFMTLLPARTDRSALRFLQQLELSSRGTSMAVLARQQQAYLAGQAAARGQTVEQFLAGEASARGYGGHRANWWLSLRPAQQNSWRRRFTEALARVRASAPPQVLASLTAAESAGGGIRFEPQEVEETGPGTLALNHGDVLGVGRTWIQAAEQNPANVFENIAHELGGHRDYGAELSWDIMSQATTPAQQAAAAANGQSLYSAYGYMETEIYAELRELPFRTPGSRGDDPNVDVERQLRAIFSSYDPAVREVIVRTFRLRIQHDANIVPAAIALFDAKVRLVFGITF